MGWGLHSGQRSEIDARRPRLTPASCSGAWTCCSRWTSQNGRGRDRHAAGLHHVGGDAKVHQWSTHVRCAGLGLDNLYVDITAEEVPILDGSAASLSLPAAKRGHRELQNVAAPKFHAPEEAPVEVREGRAAAEKWRAWPYHGYNCASKSTSSTRRWTPRVSRWSLTYWATAHARHRRAAPSASKRRGNDARAMAWPWVAAWTTPSSWTTTKCSMPTACATTTNSSAQDPGRHGRPHIIGKPIWRAYSAFRSGHALNNQLLRPAVASPGVGCG